MSLSASLEDIKQCLSQEDCNDACTVKMNISDEYHKLKKFFSGHNNLPYTWLSTMCNRKLDEFIRTENGSTLLATKIESVSPSDWTIVQNEIPFVKEKEESDDPRTTLFIQHNYFYKSILSNTNSLPMQQQLVQNHMKNIDFMKGYLATCRDCKALGLLWDILHDDDSNPMYEMEKHMRELMIKGGVSSSTIVELQQKLALALTRVYTTKYLVSDTLADKKSALCAAAVDNLVGLLKNHFNFFYDALVAKIAQSRQVHRWYSPLIPRLLSKQIRFYITGACVLSKVLQTVVVSELPDRHDVLSEIVAQININFLASHEESVVGAILQWLQVLSLFLDNVEDYTPWIHVDIMKNFPMFFWIATNLPFLLIVPFVMRTYYTQQNAKNLYFLAGLCSTNLFFFGTEAPVFYNLVINSFRQEDTGILHSIYSTLSKTQLYDHILRSNAPSESVWWRVTREILSEGPSSPPLESVYNSSASSYDLSPATARCSNQTACTTITDFTFFVALHKLSLMMANFSPKKMKTNHTKELEVFYTFQRQRMIQRNAETQQRERRQQNLLQTAAAGSRAELALTFVSEGWYNFVNWWTTPGQMVQPSFRQEEVVDFMHVQALFRRIEELWSHVSLDLLSSNAADECIIMNFQENVTAMRHMLPPLAQAFYLALTESKILESTAEQTLAFRNKVTDLGFPDDSFVTKVLVCKEFAMPDASQWKRYDPRQAESGEDQLLLEFTQQFKGFEKLPSLSDKGLSALVKKYQALELPNVDWWGAHIQLDERRRDNKISMLHILPLLLKIKISGKDLSQHFTKLMQDSRIDYDDSYKTSLDTAYALGMLKLLTESGNSPTYTILSAVDTNMPFLGPAVFFAVNYANHFSLPTKLVEKALEYIAMSRPLPINAVNDKMREYIRGRSFQKFIQEMQLNQLTREQVNTIHFNYIDNEAVDLDQYKARAVRNACSFWSPYPLPMLLRKRFLENEENVNDVKIKAYYRLNPDVLTACFIADIIMRMHLLLFEDLKNGQEVELRMKRTLNFAKNTLQINKQSLEKILFFLADYFVVYFPDDRTFIQFFNEEQVTQLKLRLKKLACRRQADPFQQLVVDKLVNKFESTQDHQEFFMNVQKCLLEAVTIMGTIFESVYN